MRLLLDTHVLLWWVEEDARLTDDVRSRLADPENTVVVSAVSAAEIAIKRAIGKLGGAPAPVILDEAGFDELPLTAGHATWLEGLPLHHRDPFDRMLVAQALAEGLVLVTVDEKVRQYDVPVFPPRGA